MHTLTSSALTVVGEDLNKFKKISKRKKNIQRAHNVV